MAVNSIREQIIQNVITSLEEIAAISTVARRKLGFSELSSIPQSQLPFIAVTAGLPSGTLKRSSRVQGNIDKIISELSIELIVYGQDNENPDQAISSLADDIWTKLYEDPQKGNLAIATSLTTNVETGIFDPYYAFSMICIVQYVHTIRGI